MKSGKPVLASNSYIFPRDLPRTGKFLDSGPHFEDPDIFYENDIADTQYLNYLKTWKFF